MTGLRDAPIGVFDSGVGGLTVLKALAAELPRERLVYLGDTARLPYGTKSPETVARYSLQASEALLEYGVKCLVVACNTASSVGLPAIRERIENVPVIGVIEPGAEAACAASRSAHIAVIATERTVREGAYQESIVRTRPDARVTAHPAPLFVALAEEGLCQGPIAESVARHYLDPLFGTVETTRDPGYTSPQADGASRAAHGLASTTGLDARAAHGLASTTGLDARAAPVAPSRTIFDARARAMADTTARSRPDTLVLGCTHFPMLLGAIRAAVGPDIRIVDSAATTAHYVREALMAASLTREAGEGAVRFLATDDPDRFARVGSRFLERQILPGQVELVDL